MRKHKCRTRLRQRAGPANLSVYALSKTQFQPGVRAAGRVWFRQSSAQDTRHVRGISAPSASTVGSVRLPGRE